MKEKFMKLSELANLLEYDDERSVLNWCKANKIPVVIAGKAKYVVSTFIDMYFNDEVAKFVKAKYQNPTEIIDAITIDDKAKLSELIEAPATQRVKKEYKKKQQHSKASQDFLNNIKAA
jgi:hypothetical protein